MAARSGEVVPQRTYHLVGRLHGHGAHLDAALALQQVDKGIEQGVSDAGT
ncbi:MAG: hypothetical protein OEQ13_08865 [Acidobacteriota bacterium]|nr:hypothetical protein [Acidobacteriota bacterium]